MFRYLGLRDSFPSHHLEGACRTKNYPLNANLSPGERAFVMNSTLTVRCISNWTAHTGGDTLSSQGLQSYGVSQVPLESWQQMGPTPYISSKP